MIALFLYFSIVLLVELALYGIVWDRPHMVAVFTSCQYIYVLVMFLKANWCNMFVWL